MTCLRCGHHTRPHGRGLCRPCHQHLTHWGDLEDYPRLVEVNAEDIAELDEQGLSARQIADRLGISKRTVCRHRVRTRTTKGAA